MPVNKIVTNSNVVVLNNTNPVTIGFAPNTGQFPAGSSLSWTFVDPNGQATFSFTVAGDGMSVVCTPLGIPMMQPASVTATITYADGSELALTQQFALTPQTITNLDLTFTQS